LTERARQMLLLVKRWLPDREIVVVADSSFAALELLEAVREEVCLITRLCLDAALYEPAPARKRGQHGRPRKKGKRLPALSQVLADGATRWQAVTLERWYSASARRVEIATGVCLWYHVGRPAVPIRWACSRWTHPIYL
jgi:hypothetical protein